MQKATLAVSRSSARALAALLESVKVISSAPRKHRHRAPKLAPPPAPAKPEYVSPVEHNKQLAALLDRMLRGNRCFDRAVFGTVTRKTARLIRERYTAEMEQAKLGAVWADLPPR